MAYCALLGGFRSFLGGSLFEVFAPLAALVTVAVWTLTPWLMLQQQVRLRVLLPTGILTGIGLAVYGATASVWMPRTVSQNRAQFGFFGVALALVTWLTGAATIIVACANAGWVLADDEGLIGRLVRGGADASLLSERAPEVMSEHVT
jgi:membrane protein